MVIVSHTQQPEAVVLGVHARQLELACAGESPKRCVNHIPHAKRKSYVWVGSSCSPASFRLQLRRMIRAAMKA